MKSWSPYVVGAGIGVLSWFAFATADHPIGVTTAFENTAALTERAAAPAVAEPLIEKKAEEGKAPKIDWEWMLVVGVFIGAWVSAKMGNDREERKVPPLWNWRFGPSVGEAVRRGVSWRGADDVWRAAGAGLHERARDQRGAATRAFELDFCLPDLRGRRGDRVRALWKGGPQPCLKNLSNSCSVCSPASSSASCCKRDASAKFRVIMGQFLFTDWTVVKIMLTAVAVGAVGVWAMVQMGWTTLHIKPAAFAPVIIGGVLFGIGMAIFGYCPGTSVAACGEGRRDAMVGVGGMLVGAFAYVAAFPALQSLTKAWGDWGKVTLPQVTGISPWIFVGAIVLATVALRLFSRRSHPESATSNPNHNSHGTHL